MHLEEKIDAYRAALKEKPRERAPLEWAEIQHCIGDALARLGEMEGNRVHYKEAVAAYKMALEERTRESAPLEWAQTQNSIGNTLHSLGELEGDRRYLEDAVKAYQAALEKRTRESAPLERAQTLNNMGDALRIIGELEGDRGCLEKAVKAYRAALEERTSEQAPLERAQTLNNLGNALRIIGELEGDRTYLGSAVEAYQAALDECTSESVPQSCREEIQSNFDSTSSIINSYKSEEERHSEYQAIRQAIHQLEVADKYGHELISRISINPKQALMNQAMTQGMLGNALARLGELEGNKEHLEEAVKNLRAALEIYESANNNDSVQENEANSQQLMAEHGGGH